jgi:hypothetical protein
LIPDQFSFSHGCWPSPLIWVNAAPALGLPPAKLMQLKNEGLFPCQSDFRLKRRKQMPADVMILSAAIVAVFVIFGSVLYWAERRTRVLSTNVESVKVKRRGF